MKAYIRATPSGLYVLPLGPVDDADAGPIMRVVSGFLRERRQTELDLSQTDDMTDTLVQVFLDARRGAGGPNGCLQFSNPSAAALHAFERCGAMEALNLAVDTSPGAD